MKGHIKIGALVSLNDPEEALKRIKLHIKYGFETLSLTFWQTTGKVDLAEAAKRIRALTEPAGVGISSVSIFGNPLTGTGSNSDSLASWERLIDAAGLFGTDLVTGFTGRIVDRPIEESIPVFKTVFGELVKRAQAKGLRIAFENCPMEGSWQRGDWNIAINPDAWRLIFDAVPAPNLGLQWEPCHQMVQLIDPLPQLRKWTSRIFNVHGKDATIAWDIIKESGAFGSRQWVWHRTPGFGDTNWCDVITILMQGGYTGSIDIEGYHDPVHRGELELAGQVRGLKYLKECRGGEVDEAF